MNEINNKDYFDVPEGNIYNDEEGEILMPLDIIPKTCKDNPAKIREEPSEVIEIYPAENPFDVVEGKVGNDMGKVWIIIHEDVLREAREIPNKFHCITPVFGEIFNFGSYNFRNPKIVYLNHIKGFPKWKIVQAWKGKDDDEFVRTPRQPEKIFVVVLKNN